MPVDFAPPPPMPPKRDEKVEAAAAAAATAKAAKEEAEAALAAAQAAPGGLDAKELTSLRMKCSITAAQAIAAAAREKAARDAAEKEHKARLAAHEISRSSARSAWVQSLQQEADKLKAKAQALQVSRKDETRRDETKRRRHVCVCTHTLAPARTPGV